MPALATELLRRGRGGEGLTAVTRTRLVYLKRCLASLQHRKIYPLVAAPSKERKMLIGRRKVQGCESCEGTALGSSPGTSERSEQEEWTPGPGEASGTPRKAVGCC